MDILSSFVKRYKKYISFPGNCYMICIQHILESNVLFFELIRDLGLKASNVYLLGKSYSTIDRCRMQLVNDGFNVYGEKKSFIVGQFTDSLRSDIDKMWFDLNKVIKKNDLLIVVDDGGILINSIPEYIIEMCGLFCIEQTTSGIQKINNDFGLRIINVAGNIIKKDIEPNYLVNELIEYTKNNFQMSSVVGVVGYGNLGKKYAKKLTELYDVFVYDKDANVYDNFPNIQYSKSLEDLYVKVNCVVGITGADLSIEKINSNYSSDQKILVSFSSHDYEYSGLLNSVKYNTMYGKCVLPDDDIICKKNGELLIVKRAGTPANFNNKYEVSKFKDILITRCLMMAAIVTGMNMKSDCSGYFDIEKDFELFVIDQINYFL